MRQLTEGYTAGNGFVFEAPTADSFFDCLREAVCFHATEPDLHRRVLQRVMGEGLTEHTLERTAREYIKVYEMLLTESA